MLNWADQFNICCFLDNHEYTLSHSSVECLLGAGDHDIYRANTGHALDGFRTWQASVNDWCFGHFAYDLKNEIESLQSSHPDGISFPDLFFFVPKVFVQLRGAVMTIGSFHDDHHAVFEDIMRAAPHQRKHVPPTIVQRYTKDEYVGAVRQLQHHIGRGDCYEVNFCQEFFATDAVIDPLGLYRKLSTLSPNPFAAFYKVDGRYLLCVSPERYLRKEGEQVYSQPIKGTRKRVPGDDERSIWEMQNDSKERAENVITVDLVRNDLSRVCRRDSVVVEDLCAVYTFPQVYQMMSTIRGVLLPGIALADVVRATFPMGSMTGAPKKRVMELIETYERSRRGLFSGSVGYCNPQGDYDFNVVIRSVLYNEPDRYLSFQTGAAITAASDPLQEYDECLLKAAVIREALADPHR